VEMSAVCDLWRLNREKAVATNAKYYGRPPRAFQHIEDVITLKDVDAVIISTPEHSHSPILKLAVEADFGQKQAKRDICPEVRILQDLSARDLI